MSSEDIPAQAEAEEQKQDDGEMELTSEHIFMKHPLKFKWVLWYLKSERGKDWLACLKKVTMFDTAEDFWSLYTHIQLASGLSYGSDYYLFKDGIQPMWEDEANINGGRWLVQVDRVVDRERVKRNERLDHYWLNLLLSVVGEQYEDYSESVCGAVINVRQKGDKVSLWTADSSDEAGVLRMGQIMRQKLDLPEGQLVYEAHRDTSQKKSSSIKHMYRV